MAQCLLSLREGCNLQLLKEKSCGRVVVIVVVRLPAVPEQSTSGFQRFNPKKSHMLPHDCMMHEHGPDLDGTLSQILKALLVVQQQEQLQPQ